MHTLTYHPSSIKGSPVVTVPASKSISNRLLLLNALHNHCLTIHNLSTSEDTLLLSSILSRYFSRATHDTPFTCDCGNAGTVLRFLTAFFSFCPGGVYRIECSTAMKARPIYPLVDALRRSGCRIGYLEQEGYPPLEITGHPPSGTLQMMTKGGVSSQYITALLLMGSRYGLNLEIKGTPVSSSYIEMTLNIFNHLNIAYRETIDGIAVTGQALSSGRISCEHDWSSAGPWYVFNALSPVGSSLRIEGLIRDSIQGDAVLAHFFKAFGVVTAYDHEGITLEKHREPEGKQLAFHIGDTPDTAPYLLAAAAACRLKMKLRGTEHLRFKESDRVMSMQKALEPANVTIREYQPGMLLMDAQQANLHKPLTVNPVGDHRIAMAMAPLVVKTGTMYMKNPKVTGKSYPNFWTQLKKCGVTVYQHP